MLKDEFEIIDSIIKLLSNPDTSLQRAIFTKDATTINIFLENAYGFIAKDPVKVMIKDNPIYTVSRIVVIRMSSEDYDRFVDSPHLSNLACTTLHGTTIFPVPDNICTSNADTYFRNWQVFLNLIINILKIDKFDDLHALLVLTIFYYVVSKYWTGIPYTTLVELFDYIDISDSSKLKDKDILKTVCVRLVEECDSLRSIDGKFWQVTNYGIIEKIYYDAIIKPSETKSEDGEVKPEKESFIQETMEDSKFGISDDPEEEYFAELEKRLETNKQ